MDFADLTITWKALKMTLAIIPGICFVTWTGHTGWMRKGLDVSDLIETYQDISNAKREAIWEFSRNILPVFPLIVFIIFNAILFIIPYDTIFISAFNIAAIPAGIISYREGRKAGRCRIKGQGWNDFDPSIFVVLRIVGVWIIFAIIILFALYSLNYWKPS